MQPGETVTDASALRQGDVIGLDWLPTVSDRKAAERPTPSGAVIVSQTCDVVQQSQSKQTVVLAPIVENASAAELRTAQRGRSPLKVWVPTQADDDLVADLQYVAHVPKDHLANQVLKARLRQGNGDAEAFSAAVGRAYSRFAFPDEVQLSLTKFRDRVQSKAGKNGPLGQALDYVLTVRAGTDNWDAPGRHLRIYFVVEEGLLIPAEDADEGWSWNVAEAELGCPVASISNNLNTVSEALVRYCEKARLGNGGYNPTTLLRLWELWGEKIYQELLAPSCDAEVSEFEVEVLNEEEFTYAEYRRTESLDLDHLSGPSS